MRTLRDVAILWRRCAHALLISILSLIVSAHAQEMPNYTTRDAKVCHNISTDNLYVTTSVVSGGGVAFNPSSGASFKSGRLMNISGSGADCISSYRNGYVLIEGGRVARVEGNHLTEVDHSNSPFNDGFQARPEPRWKGVPPVDVVRIEGGGEGATLAGIFIGIWPVGDDAMIGRFGVVAGRTTEVTPIGSVAGRVVAIDYFPALDANGGGLWFVQQRSHGVRVFGGRFDYPAAWRDEVRVAF